MTFEDLSRRVGERLGTSAWLCVDLDRVKQFAEVTLEGAFAPPSEDSDLAGLHDRIAQGALTLSLAISQAMPFTPTPEGVTSALNYGFDKLRFITPVAIGTRIRTHVDLLELEQLAGERWRATLGLTVEIEGAAKPALHARWLVHYVMPA